MSCYALFDIGGTAVKYGVADEAGRFLAKGISDNPAQAKGTPAMLTLLENLLRDMKSEYPLRGIGVSTAGVVDAERGEIVYASENIPGYTGTRLGPFMEKSGGMPCTVENDVNCAGLGEAWLGAGKGMNPFVAVTLGTGVGGCVITDGKLIHGAMNFAGEVGYLPIEGGTLEEMASVSALVRRVAKEKDLAEAAVDGKKVFTWAKQGDVVSVNAIDAMLRALAQGIWMITCVVNPSMFVIGGGIAAQKEYLQPRLVRKLSDIMLPRVFDTMKISFANLGNDAGMLGALHCILSRERVQ